MGREQIMKKIKRSGIGLTVIGGLLAAFGLLMTVVYIADSSIGENIFPALIFLIPGVLMLIFGIRNLTNPMANGMFKRNPHLLDQADNMAANKRYEDKFIVLSDRCIANAKNSYEVSYLEDVFLVYIERSTTNLIPTGKLLILATATGNIGINVYGCKKTTIDELASKISKVCPNARFGYNKEGLSYLSYMQDMYKKNMVNNRGYIQTTYILPEYMNNPTVQYQLSQAQNNNF